MKRLIKIQQKLKAPKSQYNDFGHYKYRSCEDILQAVKPLLEEQNLVLILEDEVVSVGHRIYKRNTNDSKKGVEEVVEESGGRYYIKATAKLYDDLGKLITQTSAYAREEEEKKGQDGSQVSGSSSSYARKYCLAGLFCLDSNDGIDSDATNKGDSTEKSAKKETKRFNDEQLENLKNNKEYLKKFDTSDKLLKDINKLGYSIKDDMKLKIADVRAEVE